MSVILLVLGILLTGAGVVMVGLGIPTSESAVGQTLIIAGVTALAGGPLTIGLAVVLSRLAAIAESVKAEPTDGRMPANAKRRAELATPETRLLEPRLPEARMPDARPEPAPASIDVSALAIERLRSSMPRPDRVVANGEEVPLSPNGGHSPPEAALEHKPDAVPRSGAPVEAFREPRLDFLFRGRVQRPTPPESFDAVWPKRAPARGTPDQSKAEEVARQPAPPPFVEERRAPPPPPPPPPMAPMPPMPPMPPAPPQARSVAILKSGVVDGMAYTLYADGSIEAQLPNGTVRFGSIAELRAHIEKNS